MKHPLLKTVETLDDELKGLRSEAGTRWTKLQDAQKAIAEAGERGETITTDHEAYKALDEAGKSYDEASQTITEKEALKAGLVVQMGREGITTADPSEPGKAGGINADELREALGLRTGRKTAGERVTEGELYQAAKESGLFDQSRIGHVPLGKGLEREELKALITGVSDTSAGAFVQADRVGYYSLPLRPLTVLDLITVGDTDSDLVEFVRMVSMTNNAAETAEAQSIAPIGDGTGGTVTAAVGGLKPESAMTFEVVQEAISTIAHWVPATKRALADAGQMRTIIDGMLRWGLGDRLERQIVNGNGVGENLLGLLQQTGMNSVAAGAQSHADKIRHGITEIRLDGFEPTGVLLNPLNAEEIQLSRTEEGGAGTGSYLFGAPNQPGPMTLWGKPVAESAAVPEGTAIVGAFAAAILWLREGTQVLASDSHMDFFTRNLVAVLAEMRAGFGVPTPAAFAEVDLAAA